MPRPALESKGRRDMNTFRAGAAALPLEPPLGLPMVGFIRQRYGAQGFGSPLETSAVVLDKVVSVCKIASERLEPARVVWGQDEVDLAVNRRERVEGGSILGWNPDELVDNQLTVLQARRPDESVIATLVGFGCHPVTT